MTTIEGPKSTNQSWGRPGEDVELEAEANCKHELKDRLCRSNFRRGTPWGCGQMVP